MDFLARKRILLGVTGSIAAYKSADLVRRLREQGAEVRVVMTENAKQFITPLTMQAVSGQPVHDTLFDVQAEAAMGHIELARWADVVLIAPASADFMARLHEGRADDLLTTLCLATKAPIALAPAMNQGMWAKPITQQHAESFTSRSYIILGPGEGNQACGDVGPGRMLEPDKIVNKLNKLFANNLLAGCRVLITAGPTHEAIDPVRYIANHSSGKMGYAIAAAAVEAGASVELVSGPTALPIPDRVHRIKVNSALEMHTEVMKKAPDCDIFVAVAAVADYRPTEIASEKMHKQQDEILLRLVKNPDIVQDVGQLANPPYIVGFAAETTDLEAQAAAKRSRKNMAMIVANLVGNQQGMGQDDNAVTVITEMERKVLPLQDKQKLARELVAMIAKHYKSRKHD